MAKHYYISFNSIDFTEIFPSNNPVATKSKEQGTQVWRESVDEIRITKINNQTVYDTLHSYFIDKTKFSTEIEIEIYEGTITTGVLYWKGLFSISDSVDNFENTTAILNPLRINDDYRLILEKSEHQYELDIFISILEQERVGYSEAVAIASGWVNDGVIGTAFTTLVASGGTIATAYAVAGGVYGAYVPLTTFANNDIVIVDVHTFTSNTNPTFNIMYGSNVSMTDEGAKSIATGTMGFTISTGQSARLWLESLPGTTRGTFTVRKIAAANDKTLNGEVLFTFIEEFVTNYQFMALSYDVVSTFLNNDALPTGAPSTISTFMGANPNGNYVSETTDNEMNTAIIGLLRKWFSVNASSFKLSFNEVMAQLRDMFQIYWFIDADGKFRVEHEKYFVKQVDDSTPIVLADIDEVDAKEYKYNKSKIASVETFQWAQSSNQDFVGLDIIYNNFETNNNPVSYSLSYITTDIKYVIDNLDDASNSGFGIYQCNLLTGITGADLYEIAISTGYYTSTAISNAAFSWANLHEKYWSWSRMSENATRNGTAVTMDSAMRFLEQANIRFFYATAIDPYTMISASLTGGAPIEIKRDLETDTVEMILGYDPYSL